MTERPTLPPDIIKKLQKQIDDTKAMNGGKGLVVPRYIGDLLKSVGIVEGYVVQGEIPHNETGETNE